MSCPPIDRAPPSAVPRGTARPGVAIPLAVTAVLLASTARVHAAAGDPFDDGTMGAQLGAGAGGLLVGGGVGGLAGALIAGYGAKKGDWGRPLVGALVGAFVGGETGVILGVQLAGDSKDGTGRWWGTSGGALAGVAFGGLSIYVGMRAKLPAPATFAIAAVFVLAGPIVGYHLSADERQAAVPRTVPLISFAF